MKITSSSLLIGLFLGLSVPFDSASAAGWGREVVPGRMVVRLKSPAARSAVLGAPSMKFAKLLSNPAAVGVQSKEAALDGLGMMVVDVDESQRVASMNELAARSDVRFAAPIYRYQPQLVPNDPSYNTQYHHALIGCPTAWDKTTGSSSVIIAICDTGVNGNHPDLASRMRTGFNFHDNTTNTNDTQGHGTAVAGCAAAAGNNGVGVSGVTWNCSILPVRISGPDGSAYSDTIGAAIKYAADSGAKVINCSFGPLQGDTVVESAAAYARNKGSLVFVSAGNEGVRDSAAANPNVLYIGATDANDTIASFSTYGPAIKLSAPGNRIFTTTRTGDYGYYSGTSFSSPLCAGVAALCFAANPSLSASEVESILLSTARDLGPTGKDERYGYGRVDAARAVAAAAALEPVMSEMEAPVPGSRIDSTIATFRWSPGARVQDYWLDVGTAAERVKYFSSYFPLGTTSAVVPGLPQNGSEIQAVLYSRIAGVWKTYRYTYTSAVAVVKPAEMTTPAANGATLTGSNFTFRWSAGSSVQEYWLDVGTPTNRTKFFASSLPLGTTSASVSGLPNDGTPVTAVLYSKIAGVWQTARYQYSSINVPTTLATLTAPEANSTLPGSSATFTWTAGAGVADYWLDVGTPAVRTAYYSSYFGPSARSATVNTLPSDGSTVRVTLYSRVSGVWKIVEYFFTAATPVLAELTSPAPGGVFPGSTVTFQWTAGVGVTDYWLDLGTDAARTKYLAQYYGPGVRSARISGLPLDGSDVRAVLYSRVSGVWKTRVYTYKAAVPSRAKLIEPTTSAASPTSLPVLPGSTVRFAWSEGVGVQEYWIDVGIPNSTSADRVKYYTSSFPVGTQSVNVSGLPSNGTSVQVVLYSKINGVWQTDKYQFQASRR